MKRLWLALLAALATALAAEMPGLAQEPEPADPASDDDGKAEPGKSAR